MGFTRKKITNLRGGSVPYLDPVQYKISTPEDIPKKVELLSISCHGETAPGGKFIMVPPKTYLMFLAHSGEPSEGDNPVESIYYGYKDNETKYYETLYKHIFQPYSERTQPNLKLPSEQLYIYQPGDIIPDYTLSFNNNELFIFKHGIYRLPIKTLSGKDKDVSTYLGRPLRYLRELYKTNIITRQELDELNEQDKEKILDETITDSDLEDYKKGIITTPLWSLKKLRKKMENTCCRNEDNLLLNSSINQEQLKDNLYRVRLSTIFASLPRDITKAMRFMVMNFCRVSYQDTIRDYFGQKIQYPRLIRSLSFSGKCTTDTKEKAFNIFTIYSIFCSFISPIKKQMLKEVKIRRLIQILKKILTPIGAAPFENWKKCLEPEYLILTGSERVELIQNYVGYLTTDEILELIEYYEIIKNLKDSTDNSKLKSAYEILLQPFKAIYEQLEIQTKILSEKAADKRNAIEVVYSYLRDTFEPLKIGYTDFLNLAQTSDRDILQLLKSFRDPDVNLELEKLKARRLKQLSNNNIPISMDGWIESQLEIMFEDYVGEKGNLTSRVESIPNIEVEDTSITFNDLENNSSNNYSGGKAKFKTRKNKTNKYKINKK